MLLMVEMLDKDLYFINLFTILKYGRTTLSDWLSVYLEKNGSREEHQNFSLL